MNQASILETERFIQTTEATTYRENIVASCLSRKWRMCLNLAPYQPHEDFRKSFDYVLFDPMGIKQSVKIEQQDSFKIVDEDKDSFVIELATYQAQGKQLGKLHYCTADLFCFVCTNIQKIYLFKFNELKQYIIALNELNTLSFYDSSMSSDQWKQKHDTSPVKLCYFDIKQTCIDLKDSLKVYTFQELGILSKLTKQFN